MSVGKRLPTSDKILFDFHIYKFFCKTTDGKLDLKWYKINKMNYNPNKINKMNYKAIKKIINKKEVFLVKIK